MRVVELCVSGLVTGSVFALISIGIIMIYKSSGILNFAHGYITAFGAFFSLGVVHAIGAPTVWVIPVSIVACVVLSLLMEVVVITPLRGANHMILMVATLGVALILEGVESITWGHVSDLFPKVAPGNAGTIGSLNISNQWVLTFSLTLVLVLATAAFFRFTVMGIVMRASSSNASVTEQMGFNPRVASLVSWGIAGVFAGLAAVLIAPEIAYSPASFTLVLIQAFVAVVLGGFTSLGGALLGGYFTGIAVNLYTGYVSSGSPAVFTLGLIAVVLLIRPTGLFVRGESA